MKKVLLCAAFIAASFTSIAQVGVGTTDPNASAALEIESTTSGLLPPRMTTADRDLINGGVWAEGLTIYNTDTKCLELYNGTDWISVCDGSVVTTSSLTTQVASNGTGGTYTFLNHNLGADTSLDPHTPVVGLQGAYIQWGKRGPDTTGNSTLDWQTATNAASLGFASAPTVGSTTPSGTWASAETNDDAWNVDENNPTKTLNDPCPTGYRVPTRNEWQAVHDNNDNNLTGATWSAGTEFGNALQYGPDANGKLLTLPAAGARTFSNGALTNRGIGGYYWSSTENGSFAYALYFDSSDVDPANINFRTSGFSVRCIAE
jgi:uncharacterized protein (TIGR02145 family)